MQDINETGAAGGRKGPTEPALIDEDSDRITATPNIPAPGKKAPPQSRIILVDDEHLGTIARDVMFKNVAHGKGKNTHQSDRKSGLDYKQLSCFGLEIVREEEAPLPFVVYTIDITFDVEGEWLDPFADNNGSAASESTYKLTRNGKPVPTKSKFVPYIKQTFKSTDDQDKFFPLGSDLTEKNIITMFKAWICDSLSVKKHDVDNALKTFDAALVAKSIIERYKALVEPRMTLLKQVMAYKKEIQFGSQEEIAQCRIIHGQFGLALKLVDGDGSDDSRSHSSSSGVTVHEEAPIGMEVPFPGMGRTLGDVARATMEQANLDNQASIESRWYENDENRPESFSMDERDDLRAQLAVSQSLAAWNENEKKRSDAKVQRLTAEKEQLSAELERVTEDAELQRWIAEAQRLTVNSRPPL